MLFLLITRDTFVNEIGVPRPDEVLSSVYRQQVGWGADARRGSRDSGSELRECFFLLEYASIMYYCA